jgi:hypothetical protein
VRNRIIGAGQFPVQTINYGLTRVPRAENCLLPRHGEIPFRYHGFKFTR